MEKLKELIKEDYKKHHIEIDEDYLNGIMEDKERVQAFIEILKVDMEVCA